MSPTSPPFDVAAVKARQRSTWSAGDYAAIGTTLQLTGELLCEAVDIAAGELVLDVAAGNGNAALAAARRGAVVTASDYVEQLLDRTGARATAEGLAVELRPADAEDLPFADGAFDVVLSTFGVTFTPQPDVAAAELLRVCRPGGRIGLANWSPTGFVGQLFTIVGRFVPPPPGLRSPLEWGTPPRVRELLGRGVSSLTITPRVHVLRYRSARHWLDAFRTQYGPVLKTFAALDPAAATSSTPTSSPSPPPTTRRPPAACGSPATMSRSSPSGPGKDRGPIARGLAENAPIRLAGASRQKAVWSQR